MCTPFQNQVYRAVQRIPRGSVSTYGEIARIVGCASAQAVGQALRRNPFAPDVPCHRVIRGDLTIGGFGGYTAGKAIRRKRRLLREEGVTFSDTGRLRDENRLYVFDAAQEDYSSQ